MSKQLFSNVSKPTICKVKRVIASKVIITPGKCRAASAGTARVVFYISIFPSVALRVNGARHSLLIGDGFALDSIDDDLSNSNDLEFAGHVDCSVPDIDPNPDQYHLNVYQSSKNISTVQAANDNNRNYFPAHTTIHSLSDSDLIARVAEISQKLEHCAGIHGVFEAFMDLRPMAYRADMYRVLQL